MKIHKIEIETYEKGDIVLTPAGIFKVAKDENLSGIKDFFDRPICLEDEPSGAITLIGSENVILLKDKNGE